MRQTASYDRLQSWARDFFGLELPIPRQEYKSIFRKAARAVHSDHGGDDERFKQLMGAHEIFQSFFEDPIVFTVEGSTANGHARRFETTDGIPFSELGLGLGSMKNGVPCLDCKGRGFRETHFEVGAIHCRHCAGRGKFSPACHSCEGSGKFRLRSGRFVTCRKCFGTGQNFGEKAVNCTHCEGMGYITSGKVESHYWKCYKCTGTGEIEIDNPVIPKGRLIIKQRK